MKVSLLLVGIPVCAVLVVSITGFARQRTVWRFLQLLGACCLFVVVLAHVAEGLRLFPAMNWGHTDSPGHYLDLGGATLGLILLPLGYLARILAR
jgi:hypothetical protein